MVESKFLQLSSQLRLVVFEGSSTEPLYMTVAVHNLAGKVAIITGAAGPRGIGFATAKKLAAAGAAVVLTDSPQTNDALKKRVEDLQTIDANALALPCDITDESQVTQFANWVTQQCGGIDILFNNAGVGFIKPFEESSLADFDINYQVNLRGTLAMTKAVINSMKSRGGGSIINNASIGGIYADAFFSAYNASKFAVVGFTKCVALELGEYNIRLNAICPGFTDTEMADAMLSFYATQWGCSEEQAREKCIDTIAMKRPATTEEIGDLVTFLASPQSAYITGAALPISGGFPQAL